MAALYGASVLLTNRHNDRAQGAPAGGIVSLGTTKHLAQEISDGAQPVFFPDTSGNGLRSVYVQHSGATRRHRLDRLPRPGARRGQRLPVAVERHHPAVRRLVRPHPARAGRRLRPRDLPRGGGRRPPQDRLPHPDHHHDQRRLSPRGPRTRPATCTSGRTSTLRGHGRAHPRGGRRRHHLAGPAPGAGRPGLRARLGRHRGRRLVAATPTRPTWCCSTSACPTSTASRCAAACAPADPQRPSSSSPPAPTRSTWSSASTPAPTTTSPSPSASPSCWPGSGPTSGAARPTPTLEPATVGVALDRRRRPPRFVDGDGARAAPQGVRPAGAAPGRTPVGSSPASASCTRCGTSTGSARPRRSTCTSRRCASASGRPATSSPRCAASATASRSRSATTGRSGVSTRRAPTP